MIVNLSYPAKIEFDGETYQVNFIDIENCFTYGHSLTEAIDNAQDVLGTMLQSMAKDNFILPLPGKLTKGTYLISPYPEIAAPLELYILRKQKGKTIEEIANALGISKQRYAEIENGKNLTLKTLHKVSKVLDANAIISLATI